MRITTDDIQEKLIGKKADPRLKEIAFGKIQRDILLAHLLRHVRTQDPNNFEFRFIGRGRSGSEVLLLIEPEYDIRVIKCGPKPEMEREIRQFDRADHESALALKLNSAFRPTEPSAPEVFEGHISFSLSFVGGCTTAETLKDALANDDKGLKDIAFAFEPLSQAIFRWQRPHLGATLFFKDFSWTSEAQKSIPRELRAYKARNVKSETDSLISFLNESYEGWTRALQTQCSSTGLAHGDLNFCNILLGVSRSTNDLAAFLIDFASVRNNRCPALDWAKLERDIKLRSLCEASGQNVAAFADVVRVLNDGLAGPESSLSGGESHSGKCVGLIEHIRQSYFSFFRNVSDIPWVDYLYFLLCWNMTYIATADYMALAPTFQDVIVQSAIDTLAHLQAAIAERTRPISRAKARVSKVLEIPFPLNRHLVGREHLVTEIRDTLTSRHEPVVVLHGLGGVGKTQTAIKYCREFEQEYDLIALINASDAGEMKRNLLHLTQKCGGRVVAGKTVAETAQSLLSALGSYHRWLLVFDDVEDSALLSRILPHKISGHIVITSQNPNWRALGKPIAVPLLTPPDAEQFLMTRASNKDEEAAARLAERLGYLPLALAQAAAYVEQSGISLVKYLELFDRHSETIIRLGDLGPEYPLTVATTWDLCFHAVQRKSKAAADLLNLCAYFAAEPIPIVMFNHDNDPATRGAANPSELALLENIAVLRAYSLVEVATENIAFHRLVQMIVRHRQAPGERQGWYSQGLALVTKAIRKSDLDSLYPHLLTLLNYREYLSNADDRQWSEIKQLDTLVLNLNLFTLVYAIAEADVTRSERVKDRTALMKSHLHAAAVAFLCNETYWETAVAHYLAAADLAEELRSDSDHIAARLRNTAYHLEPPWQFPRLEPQATQKMYERALQLDTQIHGRFSLAVLEDFCLLTTFHQRESNFHMAMHCAKEVITWLKDAQSKPAFRAIYANAIARFEEIIESKGRDLSFSRDIFAHRGFINPESTWVLNLFTPKPRSDTGWQT